MRFCFANKHPPEAKCACAVLLVLCSTLMCAPRAAAQEPWQPVVRPCEPSCAATACFDCRESEAYRGGPILGRRLAAWLQHRRSPDWPVDMPQHTPYLAVHQSYYYFRPYHFFHTAAHRDIAVAAGLPAHNPYSHAVFESVYRDLRLGVVSGYDLEEVLPATSEHAESSSTAALNRTTASTEPPVQ